MADKKQWDTEKQIDDDRKRGIITHSKSPSSTPIIMVRKKDGSMRMCVDNFTLNAQTIKESYPLPCIQESLVTLSGGPVL